MADAFAAALRAAARAALPSGAFLRRDRGEALYVTDAPRRQSPEAWLDAVRAAGFECRIEGGLACLTPGAVWLQRLEAAYPEPPDAFCAAFRRFEGPPDAEALRLFAMAMKPLDGGAPDPMYEKKLRQRAAVALRRHETGGGLYACALALRKSAQAGGGSGK